MGRTRQKVAVQVRFSGALVVARCYFVAPAASPLSEGKEANRQVNICCAEALLGQKKYADAEPLLLTGYEGLKAKEKDIPPQGNNNLPNASARLVKLYEAWGKPDEAATWRDRAKAAGGNKPNP